MSDWYSREPNYGTTMSGERCDGSDWNDSPPAYTPPTKKELKRRAKEQKLEKARELLTEVKAEKEAEKEIIAQEQAKAKSRTKAIVDAKALVAKADD